MMRMESPTFVILRTGHVWFVESEIARNGSKPVATHNDQLEMIRTPRICLSTNCIRSAWLRYTLPKISCLRPVGWPA